MLYYCDKHGDKIEASCVSLSISNAIQSDKLIYLNIKKINIIYPSYQDRYHISYLDNHDYTLVDDYINKSRKNHTEYPDHEINGFIKNHNKEIIIIDRDIEKKLINDRIFINKMKPRMKVICHECINDYLMGFKSNL